MKENRINLRAAAAAFGMLILILDSRTALAGATKGMELVLKTLIPSLFPFLFMSSLISTSLSGWFTKPLRVLCRICGIQSDQASLLILGLMGGYPVGAQAIVTAQRNGQLSKSTAHRLLGFCNNAGPAFIFGLIGPLFTLRRTIWLLWAVQILSVLATGALLPGKYVDKGSPFTPKQFDPTVALERSIGAMAKISAWVILFRIILDILTHWLLWLLPINWQVIITGILELTNGCCALTAIHCEGLRFVIASAFLSFGGFCVGLQTHSVVGSMGMGKYFQGKLLQTGITLTVATILQQILFTGTDCIAPNQASFIVITGIILFLCAFMRAKKVVAFQQQLMYNT